jgi:hypothetical protein
MNVFSFCLYNPYLPFYYEGLLENIELIHKHYPTWGIFVYTGNDVPDSFKDILRSLNVEIRETNETGPINMAYRFLAIEEPGVTLMMVRDADSRVHWKDRWAINEFVSSKYLAHTTRDSPVHLIPMLGGLWGLKRSAGVPVLMCFEDYKQNQTNMSGIGKDQSFLNTYVWTRIAHTLLVHSDLKFSAPGDTIVPFPFEYTNEIYCGRVEPIGYVEPPVSPLKRVQTSPILLSFLNKRNV